MRLSNEDFPLPEGPRDDVDFSGLETGSDSLKDFDIPSSPWSNLESVIRKVDINARDTVWSEGSQERWMHAEIFSSGRSLLPSIETLTLKKWRKII